VATHAHPESDANREGELGRAGFVLGLGLGGFLDGIVLHQLLQWHSLVSERRSRETLDGLEANVLADGLFHVATWLLVLLGLGLLWRAARPRSRPLDTRALLGWGIAGWGAFNLLDSVVNHFLLELHHIRQGDDELAYDLAFLALGVLLVVVGWLVARRRPVRQT